MVGLFLAASAPVRIALRRTLQRSSSLSGVLGKLSSAQLNGRTNRVRPGALYLLTLLPWSHAVLQVCAQFV